MNEQKERARADARAKKTGHADIRVFRELEKEMGGGSTFLGYTESSADATVTGILVDGVPQSVVTAPAEVEVVLDRTPFWARWAASSPTRARSGWPTAAPSRSTTSRPPSRGCMSTVAP